jgi:hypothetical protein
MVVASLGPARDLGLRAGEGVVSVVVVLFLASLPHRFFQPT